MTIDRIRSTTTSTTQQASRAEAPVPLTPATRDALVQKKATCPFLGAAVATNALPVRNDANNPLASIDDVERLGNSGGGDLGRVLALFASGNHAFMRGPSGKLDAPVPHGLFSLELPGSQGSHPGHSGMLQGNPTQLGSGRLSRADVDRLTSRAVDGRIKRSDVGRFIAENLVRDPNSKVFGNGVVGLLAKDLGEFVSTTGPLLLARLHGSPSERAAAHDHTTEALTKLLGEDNLVGSAGEFGLLFALLANKPGARTVDGEPTIDVDDVKAMFIDKRFPPGWETWKKTSHDWVKNTTGLLVSAGKEYLRLRRQHDG